MPLILGGRNATTVPVSILPPTEKTRFGNGLSVYSLAQNLIRRLRTQFVGNDISINTQ